MKILIVDDQPMMLKTLELKFSREGYEVIISSIAEEALLILSSQNIDVVLTEVSFPGAADFEILLAAKKKDYNIVVIIISIHSLEQTIIEAFELGAEEFLIKPINLNLLSIRIRKLLKVKKMREVLAKSIPASERQNLLRQLSTLNQPQFKTSIITESEMPLLSDQSAYVPERALLLEGPDHDKKEEKKEEEKKDIEKKSLKKAIASPKEEKEKFIWNFKNVKQKVEKSLIEYIPLLTVFIIFIILNRVLEIFRDYSMHGPPASLGKVIFFSLIKDLLFCLHTGFVLYLIYIILYFINKKAAKLAFAIISTFLLIIQMSLSQYFLTALVPLGSDLWNYTYSDVKQTFLASGGITIPMILVFIITISTVTLSFIYIPKKLKIEQSASYLIGACLLSAMLIDNFSINRKLMPGREYSNNLSINKSWYFFNASWLHFFPSVDNSLYKVAPVSDNKLNSLVAQRATDSTFLINYPDASKYPFLHTIDSNRDVLSPFFDSSKVLPNIVVICVEGMGRAFTNKNAYVGNFTPFMDSLSEHCLYWENFLSAAGRTFGVLPSVLGSLPFHKIGFHGMGDKMPPHISLLSILKKNGYKTSYYYGGDAKFDFMEVFLKKNFIDYIWDAKTFPAPYKKMPASEAGVQWGFSDKDLFSRYFETIQNVQPPFASVFLTLSSHNPYLVDEEQKYLLKFDARLEELKLDEVKKTFAKNYRNQLATVLYMDDAVKGFISRYKQRPDFANTIFIITGDHRMFEIPFSTKIDRYHVPLLIYSPLLSRTKKMSSISTHLDITPSITMLLHKKFGLQIPFMSQYMGFGLDTNASFRNIHSYPFKQARNEMMGDFIDGEYFLSEGNLFKIYSNMDIEPENNPAKLSEITAKFEDFKRKNQNLIDTEKLIPDSLAKRWGSK